jgi:hypothetical protein
MCCHNGCHLDEEWLSSVAHIGQDEQGAVAWMGLPGGQDIGIERRHPGVEQVLFHCCAELKPGAAIGQVLFHCCAELKPGVAIEQALPLRCCAELKPGAAIGQALLHCCAELKPGAAIGQALYEQREPLMLWLFQDRFSAAHEPVMLCYW